MAGLFKHRNFRALSGAAAVGAALVALVLWSVSAAAAGAASRPAAPPAAVPVATPGQDFQDVEPSNPFYSYLHNLAGAGVVGGYGCGGTTPPEPCVPPSNLPYYRPTNAVTRLQMTKFIDLGRRTIADATGTSLVISGTAYNSITAYTTSGGSAIVGQCLTPGTACYAVSGGGTTGDFGGYFAGGRGVYAGSGDPQRPALDTAASGNTAVGVNAYSQSYRGLNTSRGNTAYFSAYVDKMTGESANNTIAVVAASMEIYGNLAVDGSKGGYVVDAMQNMDSGPLEPGDVVVIVGSSAPVVGQIPVVTVRKASSAYDTELAGVVDQPLYVPDAATRAAYLAQQAAQRAAQAAHAQALQAAANGKPAADDSPPPLAQISDEQGTVHATDAPQVPPGGYVNVVTLGAYKAIKVDADLGAIHAGDLLTTSAHAGYAMKVTDKVAAIGAIIGKALADLPAGTGTIPVLVTMK
jgi:hypothetical protein